MGPIAESIDDGLTARGKEMTGPLPNFLKTDDLDGGMEHHPHTIDASIPLLLAHRGVPACRISALLIDLDDTTGLADYEMASLLPARADMRRVGMHLVFEAMLDADVTWTGERLTMPDRLPETVVAGLPGRMLRSIIDHPALPDRLITSAATGDGRLVIEVEGDRRQVFELAAGDADVVAGTRDRLAARRRWIDENATSTHEEDWFHVIHTQVDAGREAFLKGEAVVPSEECWGQRPRLATALVAMEAPDAVGRRMRAMTMVAKRMRGGLTRAASALRKAA